MNKVTRYEIGGVGLGEVDCDESVSGEWVQYRDYAALESQLAAVTAERDVLKEREKVWEHRQAKLAGWSGNDISEVEEWYPMPPLLPVAADAKEVDDGTT